MIEKQENLESHLTELRQRIIYSLVICLISLIVAFAFSSKTILQLQKLAPAGATFFQLRPGELFFVHLKTATYLAFMIAYPFLLGQLKAFIWPGLKSQEKQTSNIIIIGSPFLFLIGLAFAYFLALKPMLNFLFGFGLESGLVEAHYSLDYFISFVLSIFFILGLSFQLPILVFILAIFNLITSGQLTKHWQIICFGIFALAAIITPTPDPFNMILVGLALIFLYGLSILIIKLCGK